jgi:hypothetical protein
MWRYIQWLDVRQRPQEPQRGIVMKPWCTERHTSTAIPFEVRKIIIHCWIYSTTTTTTKRRGLGFILLDLKCMFYKTIELMELCVIFLLGEHQLLSFPVMGLWNLAGCLRRGWHTSLTKKDLHNIKTYTLKCMVDDKTLPDDQSKFVVYARTQW